MRALQHSLLESKGKGGHLSLWHGELRLCQRRHFLKTRLFPLILPHPVASFWVGSLGVHNCCKGRRDKVFSPRRSNLILFNILTFNFSLAFTLSFFFCLRVFRLLFALRGEDGPVPKVHWRLELPCRTTTEDEMRRHVERLESWILRSW